MSFFDATVPSDNEAFDLGAMRIREIKSDLNPLIAQIFNDSGSFLDGWVTQESIAAGAVGAAQIAVSSITNTLLVPGILSADVTGRALVANGFITSAMVSPSFVVPNASVTSTQLAAAAVATANIEDAAVTFAKLAAGVGLSCVIGSYAGSNTSSQSITTLPWSPDILIIFNDVLQDGWAMALQSEAQSGKSNAKLSWSNATFGSGNWRFGAIQWESNGFIVVPFNQAINQLGNTHSWVALKLS